ncbi:hypothetical protein LCGC14_0495050 [marine sediment metagenome]|uniref:Uncharacterized protein n=1 Tax=marine sediment metagenome TaxID=412755 RepID=A0A0F9VE44_9ZZZZ
MIFNQTDTKLVKFLKKSHTNGYLSSNWMKNKYDIRNREKKIKGWLYYSDGEETTVKPFFGTRKEAEQIKEMLRKKNDR